MAYKRSGVALRESKASLPLAEGQRRARALGTNHVTFIAAHSDDLGALRASLGSFRTALMGQSFHWMLEKDRLLTYHSGSGFHQHGPLSRRASTAQRPISAICSSESDAKLRAAANA